MINRALLIFAIFAVAYIGISSAGTYPTKTVFNPFTGKFDFILNGSSIFTAVSSASKPAASNVSYSSYTSTQTWTNVQTAIVGTNQLLSSHATKTTDPHSADMTVTGSVTSPTIQGSTSVGGTIYIRGTSSTGGRITALDTVYGNFSGGTVKATSIPMLVSHNAGLSSHSGGFTNLPVGKITGGSAIFTIMTTTQLVIKSSSSSAGQLKIYNASTLGSSAFASFYPETGTNTGLSFQMIPKGTGQNANIKSQVSIFNTDFISDATNYESLVLRAAGARYSLNATAGGTGAARPIEFQMMNAAKMTVDTDGRVRFTGQPAAPLSTDACTAGDTIWSVTTGYLYFCIASGNWGRATFTTGY